MPDVGDSQTVTLTVAPADGTTAVVLTLTAPDGTATTPAVTGSGATWTATATYATAGVWTLRWVVTGTGAGVEYSTVTIAPAQPGAARSYATTTDLATWLGDTPSTGSARTLARATRYMDNVLLKTSNYEVDDDGQPTNTRVINALRDACCALVEWWDANGDDGLGAGSEYTSVSAGGIALSKGGGGSSAAPADPRRAPEAVEILDGAGLLGHSPWTYS